MLVVFIILCIIVILILRSAMKGGKRERQIEELRELILMCDANQIPFDRVESFCEENDFSDVEYHTVRKNLYIEKAESDDIHALTMAAAYMENEDKGAKIRYLTRAAELGDVESMYYLGLILKYNDEYLEYRDLKKALYWFENAAKTGHEGSIVEVANAYRFGDGVEENKDKAYSILKDYSDRGYSDCSMILARDYYGSIGNPYYNLKQAEQLYIRVIQRGDRELFAEAADRLGYLYGGCYIYNAPTDELSDRRKAAYCYALAYFADPDNDLDKLNKVGYRYTEREMQGGKNDAQNLRYNPI